MSPLCGILGPISKLVLLTILLSIGVKAGENTSGSTNPDWYSAQFTNSNNNPAHVYSKSQARDSYLDAASSGSVHGGNDLSTSGQPVRYHYQMYPNDHGGHYTSGSNSYGAPNSYGYGGGDDDIGYSGGGSSNGLWGLFGLLGLKGLKAGLPFILPILGPLLLPILLIIGAPILLVLALPLLLLLLFIPVPVVTVPTGRILNSVSAREFKEIVLEEDCIERVTCEATRFAKNFGFNPTWVQEYLEKSGPTSKWIERVSKGIQSTDCQKFICNPSAVIKKSLKVGKQEAST